MQISGGMHAVSSGDHGVTSQQLRLHNSEHCFASHQAWLVQLRLVACRREMRNVMAGEMA